MYTKIGIDVPKLNGFLSFRYQDPLYGGPLATRAKLLCFYHNNDFCFLLHEVIINKDDFLNSQNEMIKDFIDTCLNDLDLRIELANIAFKSQEMTS